jgi:hypothetical protein
MPISRSPAIPALADAGGLVGCDPNAGLRYAPAWPGQLRRG